MEGWYLLYCRSRQEERARIHLNNQGFSTYLPRVQVTRIVAGRRQCREEVLFPSYLFVHTDPFSSSYHKIRSTRGVSAFVRSGDQPLRVADQLVKTLALNEEKLELSGVLNNDYAIGDTVDVTEGAFKGLKAVYQMPKGEDRALIMINLLQQQMSVEVPLQDITPAVAI